MAKIKINNGNDIIKFLSFISPVTKYIKNLPFKEIVDILFIIEKFNLDISSDSLRRHLKKELKSNFIKINNRVYFGSEKTIKFLSEEIKKLSL